VDVTAVGVAPNARHALFRVSTTDYEDAWLVVVDLPSLERRAVAHLHDDAWLDGPLGQTAGWLRDGQTVFFGSETSGWAHLYTVPAMGGTPRALTAGEWGQVELSPDGRPSASTPTKGLRAGALLDARRRRWAASPGDRRRRAAGRGRVSGRPHARGAALSANRPPELYLQTSRPGAERGASPRARRRFSARLDRSAGIVIRATDGTAVPARLYRPRGAAANGAAVIFVHGAGYLQNVHKWWSSYYREYLFHHLLASRGYAVLDLDYRGSAGHGRDWRTAIYRHMGGRDLDDQVDAASWLVRELGVDSTRIGIYGGSYGRFITLMAMFTRPGVFAAGAALRPVTDWAHYNHPYTARILNSPQDDSTAYRWSSPIYYAEGLAGHLLICHGMVDDNVHFSDTVRLIQRLIELGKDRWEAAIYPVEPHGFLRADSWRDEYRRILRLFESALR
jgi:dipeptidyl aminopeptidase/acylaminoacyl peptidase